MAGKYSELSFCSHRVLIRIEGFRLNRVVTQAMKAGIQLKHIRMVSETEMVCWISAGDLKLLRSLAKSLYRITVLESCGPIPRTQAFIRKPGLVIGCLLAIVMVIFQGFFVETIQINGYKAIPEQALLECLETQGIVKGAFRPDIDWNEAEQEIYRIFPQVTWVQLVYSGRMVILNIAETDHEIYGVDVPSKPPSDSEDLPQHYTSLVASHSGYIETIYPYYGQAVVEAGDYVEEGQVLISGCVPIEPTTFAEEGEEQRTEYFVNAKGEVQAAVPYKLTFSQERYIWGSSADSMDNGEVVVSKVEKTEEQAKRKAEQQIRTWEKENLPETAEILKKSLKFSRDGNIIKVSVLLEVRQQIAIPQEELIGKKITDTRND